MLRKRPRTTTCRDLINGSRSTGCGFDTETLGSEILPTVDRVMANVEDGHADIAPSRCLREPNRRSPAGNRVSLDVGNVVRSPVSVCFATYSRVPSGQQRGERLRWARSWGWWQRRRYQRASFAYSCASLRGDRGGPPKGMLLRFREQWGDDWMAPGTVIEF